MFRQRCILQCYVRSSTSMFYCVVRACLEILGNSRVHSFVSTERVSIASYHVASNIIISGPRPIAPEFLSFMTEMKYSNKMTTSTFQRGLISINEENMRMKFLYPTSYTSRLGEACHHSRVSGEIPSVVSMPPVPQARDWRKRKERGTRQCREAQRPRRRREMRRYFDR